MALYEYECPNCGNRFEKRMPMTDVLQLVPCPNCKKKAKKVIGNFAVVGRADEGIGDGEAPWDGDGDDAGGDDDGLGGMDGFPDLGHHGHSHGPGGHTHPH